MNSRKGGGERVVKTNISFILQWNIPKIEKIEENDCIVSLFDPSLIFSFFLFC